MIKDVKLVTLILKGKIKLYDMINFEEEKHTAIF